MFTFKPPKRSALRLSNFYQIRRGDLIALSFLRAGLCKQYDEDFQIGICDDANFCGEFIDVVGNGLFRASENEEQFPVSGTLWPFAKYAREVIGAFPSFPCSDVSDDSIVVAPVFDAGYNLDRNWNPIWTRKLLDVLIETGRKVIVTGVHNLENYCSLSGTTPMLGSLAQTAKAIRSCETFIGGDTGTTHYAAVLESHCKIIALYGAMSPTRRYDSHAYLDKFINKKPPPFDYMPFVRDGHEFLYREFPAKVEDVVEFILSTAKVNLHSETANCI